MGGGTASGWWGGESETSRLGAVRRRRAAHVVLVAVAAVKSIARRSPRAPTPCLLRLLLSSGERAEHARRLKRHLVCEGGARVVRRRSGVGGEASQGSRGTCADGLRLGRIGSGRRTNSACGKSEATTRGNYEDRGSWPANECECVSHRTTSRGPARRRLGAVAKLHTWSNRRWSNWARREHARRDWRRVHGPAGRLLGPLLFDPCPLERAAACADP